MEEVKKSAGLVPCLCGVDIGHGEVHPPGNLIEDLDVKSGYRILCLIIDREGRVMLGNHFKLNALEV